METQAKTKMNTIGKGKYYYYKLSTITLFSQKIDSKTCPMGLQCCLNLGKIFLQYLLPNSTKNYLYNAINVLK